jgi:hypothetical protein
MEPCAGMVGGDRAWIDAEAEMPMSTIFSRIFGYILANIHGAHGLLELFFAVDYKTTLTVLRTI